MRSDLPREVDATALDRYLAGECSDVERATVAKWLADVPERLATIRALRCVLSGEISTRPVDAKAEWDRFKACRTSPVRKPARRPFDVWNGIRGPTVVRGIWATLVTFLVGAAGVVAGWRTVAHRNNAHLAPASGVSTIYSTANGQRANISLPDGSQVTLNVASRLEVPADYARGNRVLRLNGEALFTVRHRTGVPFTVITGETITRVLGTTFSVRHYATDSTTLVAVRDGRVGVGSVVVAAAEMVEVSRGGPVRLRPAVPSQFGFASGVLTLNDVPLAAAIRELDRWYDADIRLGDTALGSERMTGEYGSGSLAELANILTGTFGVRVVRNGRVLTLYPR